MSSRSSGLPVIAHFFCIAAVAALACPALAQTVHIDYDHEAQLGGFKSFAFTSTDDDLAKASPLMHERVLDALRRQLGAGGMQEVATDPDLVVAYHVTVKQETSISTSGYAPGPGWGGGYYYGGGGWSSASTTVSTYDVGTLIIDIYDAGAERLIWRGSAQSTVPQNPEKGAKKIDKMIDKLAKKWKSMRGAD